MKNNDNTSLWLKKSTKDDFHKKIKAKLTEIYGKLSDDEVILKLINKSNEIIELFN